MAAELKRTSSLAKINDDDTSVPTKVSEDSIFGFYWGKLEIVGEIVAPFYSDKESEQFYNNSAEQLEADGQLER